MPPLIGKLPAGTTHVVSFLWRPIFCQSGEEAEARVADIGDANTPYEFFQRNDPEKAR